MALPIHHHGTVRNIIKFIEKFADIADIITDAGEGLAILESEHIDRKKKLNSTLDKALSPMFLETLGVIGTVIAAFFSPITAVLIPICGFGIGMEAKKIYDIRKIQEEIGHVNDIANNQGFTQKEIGRTILLFSKEVGETLQTLVEEQRENTIKQLKLTKHDDNKAEESKQRLEKKLGGNKSALKGGLSALIDSGPATGLAIAGAVVSANVVAIVGATVSATVTALGVGLEAKEAKELDKEKCELITKHVSDYKKIIGIDYKDGQSRNQLLEYKISEEANTYAIKMISEEIRDNKMTKEISKEELREKLNTYRDDYLNKPIKERAENYVEQQLKIALWKGIAVQEKIDMLTKKKEDLLNSKSNIVEQKQEKLEKEKTTELSNIEIIEKAIDYYKKNYNDELNLATTTKAFNASDLKKDPEIGIKRLKLNEAESRISNKSQKEYIQNHEVVSDTKLYLNSLKSFVKEGFSLTKSVELIDVLYTEEGREKPKYVNELKKVNEGFQKLNSEIDEKKKAEVADFGTSIEKPSPKTIIKIDDMEINMDETTKKRANTITSLSPSVIESVEALKTSVEALNLKPNQNIVKEEVKKNVKEESKNSKHEHADKIIQERLSHTSSHEI